MPAVVVEDLVVRYGDVVAVTKVSFEADAGEVVAVLGPNGAGKTSTIETVEGYRRPSSGAVSVLGLDPVREAPELRPRIGVMLQRGGVYPAMRPREVARLFAAYYESAADPDETLRRVGLEGRVLSTPWRALSGGEQQRVSLALALLPRPEVVFLDEPTAGIDPAGRLIVRDVVRSLRDEGACVLLTTHDLVEAERTADRILIIDRGRIVASGTPHELVSSGAGEVRFAAAPGLDVSALGASLSATVTEERPGQYVVSGEASPQRVAAVTAWLAEREITISDLRAGSGSLEDVFLRLTSEERS